MNKEKFKDRSLEFKYTVELAWNDIYEFCDEQREAAFAFAEMAVANKKMNDKQEAAGDKMKVTVTIEEV